MPTELKTVDDVMTRKLVTVAEHDLLAEAEQAMLRLRVRHLPVVDRSGNLVGLISHGDLLHAASTPLSDREADRNAIISGVQVGKVMQRELLTVQPSDLLIEAGKLMWDSKVSCLPVVDPYGALLGIITEADFIRIAVELLGSDIKKSDVEELARAAREPQTHVA
jgi:CBS domain-containing membrane protein